MKIRYFSWVKNITNLESEEINNSKITDVNSLKKNLCLKYPKLEEYIIKKKIIRIAINFEYETKNIKINSNDEVALFPPVSGG